MFYNILISSSSLTDNDIANLNHGETQIRFEKTKASNFLPESNEIVLVLIEGLMCNVTFDILKNIFNKLFGVMSQKKSPDGTMMEVACNGKKCSLRFDYQLSEDQKIRIIEAAARTLAYE